MKGARGEMDAEQTGGGTSPLPWSEMVCSVCGEPLGGTGSGVVWVQRDPESGEEVTTGFCSRHHPNPPTPRQLEDQARQERESAAVAIASMERLIRSMGADERRPVTWEDRENIGSILLRMLHWLTGLENELRALQGKPPIDVDALGNAPRAEQD